MYYLCFHAIAKHSKVLRTFWVSCRFPQKYFKHVSREAKDLVRKLLIVEPEERLRCVVCVSLCACVYISLP